MVSKSSATQPFIISGILIAPNHPRLQFFQTPLSACYKPRQNIVVSLPSPLILFSFSSLLEVRHADVLHLFNTLMYPRYLV